MNTNLKAQLETAINDIIEDNCEEGFWDGYIHDRLIPQMATAAATVFDSCMDGQKFAKGQEIE